MQPSLHKEIQFENDICAHLAAHGWEALTKNNGASAEATRIRDCSSIGMSWNGS